MARDQDKDQEEVGELSESKMSKEVGGNWTRRVEQGYPVTWGKGYDNCECMINLENGATSLYMAYTLHQQGKSYDNCECIEWEENDVL